MEAVQRHVPLIASDCCGADDFLTPNLHYRSYEAGNSSQLEVQINEVRTNLKSAIQAAELASIELNNYNFEDMYNDTLKVALRTF
jgi:hypothetical protein